MSSVAFNIGGTKCSYTLLYVKSTKCDKSRNLSNFVRDFYCRDGNMFIGVCLFVCLSAGLRKNYSTDFNEIWCKGDTWATKKPLDFGVNADHVTLGFGYRVTFEVV